MSMCFQGTAWALSTAGIATAAAKLSVGPPEIWAVLTVETSSCGYLADRRPQICFERHIFHRLTDGKFDDGDISDSSPGGYGALGAHQYERLNLAMARNQNAALQSASWGIGQIMGENFAAAGYIRVEDFVMAMLQSEDDQLAAMANFLVTRKLHRFLRAHDWAAFALHYNGPEYAVNHYDARLEAEYQKYSSGLLPDLTVRAAQLYLAYVGFHPGPVDGIAGQLTLSALTQFHTHAGLPVTETITAETVAQLQTSLQAVA
jgi:hypothetical protein